MILTERDQARFWAKVALPDASGCMLWLAGKSGYGYGQFWLAGKHVYAHRVSYTLAYGPIPDGLQVDHVKTRGCASRHCVAPLHLEAVTTGENTRRGDSGAHERAKTHCPQEHPYNEANTYVKPSGGRRCRACNRECSRRYRAKEARP